jgi:hypothetical protein
VTLAYVFWHWPEPDAPVAEYEGSLLEFHVLLAGSGVEGFIASASFRIRGVPWANGGGEAYADWYLLEGSFALDPLNEVAVSGRRRASHDRAAHLAAGGAGGLLRLREGDPDLEAARVETWISKPKGMSYADFYGRLGPAVAGGAELWRRQMVLGPEPEFCLAAGSSLGLPGDFRPLEIRRDLVTAPPR